jgi:tape measure domain-containing protein
VASLDEVGVRLKATGRAETTRDIREVRREIEGVQRAAKGVGDREVARGLGDLGGVFGGLSQQVGGVHSSLLSASSTMQTFITRGTLGLGALAATAVGFGLKAASGFEQSEIAFGTLLGSMEHGEDMLRRLQEFNLQTPFELPGLAGATQQLLLYGYAGEQAFQTVKTVSDIAASSGPRMTESLGRMTLALGQIRAKGVVQGEELRQLTEAGFPALELLTELTGRTGPELRKAMETGLDPQIAQDFLAAVETGQAQTFARFRGGAAAQAKTLAGVVSNLKDTLQIGLAGETQPLADALVGNMPALQESIAGLISAAMPGLTELLSTLAEGAPGTITAFTPVLGQLTTGLADLAAEIGPHMPEIIDLMADFLGLFPELIELGIDLIPVLGGMVDVFGDFLDLPFGSEMAGMLLVTLLGYRALTGVAGIITGIAGAIDVLTGAQARNAAVAGGPGAVGAGRGGRFARVGAGVAGGLGVAGTAYGVAAGADSGLGWNSLGTVGSGALTGAAIGSVVPVVGTGIGAALGAGIAGVGVLGAEVYRQQSATVPAAARSGGTVVHSRTQVGDVIVNNPTSNVDVKRAIREAIEEAESEKQLRGSVGVGLASG